MVRKWSTGPISLSYTTHLSAQARPSAEETRRGCGVELVRGLPCRQRLSIYFWKYVSEDGTRAANFGDEVGETTHLRRRSTQLFWCGRADGRSLTRPFRDARRFPSTRV
jgi:hypothetical protein